MNYIIHKYGLPNDNFIFPEGNVYILQKDVANYLFDNRFNIYHKLNTTDSFDYSWVVNYYKLKGMGESEVYQKYLKEKLKGNNLQTKLGWRGLADCMIEHTFERITFTTCKLLGKQVKLINESENTQFTSLTPVVLNEIYYNISQ